MAERLEPVIVWALVERPRSEDELLSISINALGAEAGVAELGAGVAKLWSLQHDRGISENTALREVMRNIRAVLGIVKKRILDAEYCEKAHGVTISKVGRRIQFGRKNYGSIYFVKNGTRYDWKAEVSSLARKLILESAEKESAVRTILDALERDDHVFVKDLPHQYRSIRQGVDLLAEHWLAEEKTLPDGTRVITVPGFAPESINLIITKDGITVAEGGTGMAATDDGEGFAKQFFEKNSAKPESMKFYENFSANTWTIGPEGPKISKISFSLVVFDPESQALHVADCSSKRAGTSELRELHSKKMQWGLPSRMHYFAPGFSSTARALAAELGIVLHETA